MQLNKIEMENFRQYSGKHKIEFSNGEKNITLVLGENNAGKTGIYRALLFGLYGDRILAQDSSSRNIHLVNLKALSDNDLVKARVKIFVSHNKGEYIISRSLKAINNNGKYLEDQNDELVLDFIDLSGEYHKDYIGDREDIQAAINKMLDENIKEFFLFDGEKIETLARAGVESRKEVKNGIIKLMEIDKLEKASQIIMNLKNKEQKRLTQKSSNSILKDVEKNIDSHKREIENSLEQKREYEANLQATKKEIEKIELELSKSEDIRGLFNDKEKHLISLKSIKEKIDTSKKMLEEYHFRQGSSIILGDYFIKLNNYLKDELLKQDDVISIHVIEETLKRGICLCCNQEVENNEESLAFLEKMKKNYRPSKVTGLMDIIYRESDKNIQNKDEKIEKIGSILKEIQEFESEKEFIESEISKIDEKISGESKNEENLKNKENRHRELFSHKDRDERNIYGLEKKIEEAREKLNKLELEYNKLLKEDESLNYEIKRLEMLNKLHDKLSSMYNKYIDITREKLGKETTRSFKELIDSEKMSLVDQIIISDKYEMDIKDSQGRNVTQDISQGQQMVVALSFITSLARIASKNKGKVEYPLFMDTPFSRLSKQNRKNLIENLPKLTRQWIPLLTDTEYSDFEKDIFQKTNRIGKIYKIVKINKEESKIVEIEE